jgi:hypothetical protein
MLQTVARAPKVEAKAQKDQKERGHQGIQGTQDEICDRAPAS